MFRLKNRLIKENKDVLGSRGIKNAAGKVVCGERE